VEHDRAVAEFGGLDAALDCMACGGPFHVEGDVSNGELVTCPNCGLEVEVSGR